MSERKQMPDKDDLVAMYNDEKMTLLEIGLVYDCSDVTVLKWFKRYGIPRNARGGNKLNPCLRLPVDVSKKVKHGDRHDIEKGTCHILKKHAHDLRDDHERMSTEFMQKIIGVNCDT